MCQNCSSLLISLHLQRSFTLVTEQTSGLAAGLRILRHWPFCLALLEILDLIHRGRKARETAIPINSHCIHCHLVPQNSGSDFLNSCWEYLLGHWVCFWCTITFVSSSRTCSLLYWVCFELENSILVTFFFLLPQMNKTIILMDCTQSGYRNNLRDNSTLQPKRYLSQNTLHTYRKRILKNVILSKKEPLEAQELKIPNSLRTMS